jgi:hypothetical protein
MDSTSIQGTLRTIVAAEIGVPHLTDLDFSARLADYRYNARRLLHRLEFEGEAPGDLEQITLSQLASLLEPQPPGVHTTLGVLATEARVTRLLLGTLVATQTEPVGYDEPQWWWHLVHQTLWWYAGREGDAGRELVRRDSPGRAMDSLTALGLLELDELAADKAENRSSFCDMLRRLGYPEQVANTAYAALVGIATKILDEYDGKLQQLLQPHVDRMANAVADEVARAANSEMFPKEAIRAWVAVITNLPVTTWSPSVMDFIKKFQPMGVSGEMLTQVRADLGLSLPSVDESLAQFMEVLCRGCDPGNEADRHCVKRFTDIDWQVECPGRRHPQSIAQTDYAPSRQRRLPAIATEGPA